MINVFPFFIECSKHYQHDLYKQKFLQRLAFGNGIHIIKRKDKNIMITANGEFIIPSAYSDNARKELVGKLWEINEYTRLGDCIEDMRRTWHTARKKDKIYLLYKYVAGLTDISRQEKKVMCNILILALLLKMIKPTDITYKDSKIVDVSDHITRKETYTEMNFTFDYSIPQHTRTHDFTTTTACTVDEEDD
mgnify:FL=1|jgi:hypothetical protein